MRNIINFCFLIFLTVIIPIHSIFGQAINGLVKDGVMPSASGGALGKFGDIPVNQSTGIPATGVPIYTVTDGALSLPIALSYHASGVKVADLASWVGIGWNLDAGGAILRTVQGLPDEGNNGYLSVSNTLQSPYTGSTQFANQSLDAAKGLLDTEPDIFTYNFGGYSGKFYFDQNDLPVFVPHADFKVQFSVGNVGPVGGLNFSSFLVTTPDGTRYHFGAFHNETTLPKNQSREYMRDDQSAAFGTAWYLVKVERYDRKQVITLEYEDEDYSFRTPASCTYGATTCGVGNAGGGGSALTCNGTGSVNTTSYLRFKVNGKKLSKIVSPTTTVEFLATKNRDDLDPFEPNGSIKPKALESIRITQGTFQKSFVFTTDYFTDPNTNLGTSELKRLKLLQIQEIPSATGAGEPAASIPPYVFDYEGNYLPSRMSKATDKWGFHNGQNFNNANYINVPSNSSVSFPDGSSLTYGSSNRDTYETPMKTGVLRKITYPTGGFTEFEYEANRYSRSYSSTVETPILPSPYTLSNCGAPTGSTSACCSVTENVMLNVTLTNDDIDRGWFRLAAYSSSCSVSGRRACTGNVVDTWGNVMVEIRRNGELLYQLSTDITNTNTNGPVNKELQTDLPFLTPGVYDFKICAIDCKGTFYLFRQDPVEVNTEQLVGGLRVKSIRNHDNLDAQKDVTRTFEYTDPTDPGKSSGILYNEPQFGISLSFSNFMRLDGQATGIVGYWGFFDQNIVPLSAFEGYHIGYTAVTEKLNGIGKTVYTLSEELVPVNGDVPYPIVPKYGRIFTGKTESVQYYSEGNTTPVASTLTSPYINDTYSYSTGVIYKSIKLPLSTSGCGQSLSNVIFYGINPYKIRTSIYRPGTTTKTIDGVSSTVNYTYAAPSSRPLAARTMSVKNSDNKYTITRYTYPTDLPASCVQKSLVDEHHIIGMPLQTLVEVNESGSLQAPGVMVGGTKLEFGLYSNSTGAISTVSSCPSAPVSGYLPYPYRLWSYEMTWEENQNGQTNPTNQTRDGNGFPANWTLESYINNIHLATGFPSERTKTGGWATEYFTWDYLSKQLVQRDFNNFRWQYLYHGGTGMLQTETDIDGQTTHYSYDKLMRPSTVTARGGKIKSTYTYSYFGQGISATLNSMHTKLELTEGSSTRTLETRDYYDGLGRGIQSIALRQNPGDNKDVVHALEYDQYGRVLKNYTPFVSTATNNGDYSGVPTGQKFSQPIYEASPLSRPLSITSPETWHTASFTYGSNTAADLVALNGSTNVFYGVGELAKQGMTDADGNKAYSFTDKLGRVVLSRTTDPSGSQKADTYNLYDDKGRITYTLPPQVTMGNVDLLYAYRYDASDRLTGIKQPDASWTGIWYNDRDLPALYQDGNMAAGSSPKYLATTYDVYGRETKTGFVGSIPSNLANITIAAGDVLTEMTYGTTAESNPVNKVNLLKARYKILTATGDYSSLLGTDYYYDEFGRISYTKSNDIRELDIYNERIDYSYDMLDNVLVQQHEHITPLVSGSKFFKHTWEYDTWGRSTAYHLNPTTTASTAKGQQIAAYNYDLRGRLTQRSLGKHGSSNWLQSLDYTYNELDWLTSINPQGSTGLGTTQNMNEPLGIPTPGSPLSPSTKPDDNDLFFLELKYHDPYANLDVPATSRKTGDVSQVWWRTRGRNREGYGLTYDYLGRMLKAQHVRLDNNSTPTTPGARVINTYSEQLEYADPRGNISRILRYGMNYGNPQNASSGVIDNLEFITLPGYNRLQRINEQASDMSLKLKGFRPKTEASGATSTVGIDYTYDANGNLKSDPHKGISSISYNHLNLPLLISYTDGRQIEMRYDAFGNLLFRWMTGDVPTPANNYLQSYVNGIEYRWNVIESVAHQEGRIFNTVNSNTANWRYEYNITDHLGNTRLTFADKTPDGIIKVEDGEVLEEAHYYPFGLAMEGPWMNDAVALDTRYKFNGIERVQDFGLNVDMAMFRSYDPAIGRWWQADPLAALAPAQTPYRFGFNSPMNFSDPSGLFETDEEAKKYQQEHGIAGKVKRQKDGTFAIVDKESGGFVTNDKEHGITFGVTAKRGDPKARQGTISSYEPSFWDKAQESKNFFVQLGYGTIDGFYTYFQAMNPLDTRVTHLGHGLLTQNEAQDLAFVHGSIIPGASVANAVGKSGRIIVYGADRVTRLNSARMVAEKGVTQILVHGFVDGFIINGEKITAKQLAGSLLNNGFKKGTPVRLISCRTGMYNDGAAYQLSRYLKSPVTAPTNRITTLEGGSYFIETGGRFKVFHNTTIK